MMMNVMYGESLFLYIETNGKTVWPQHVATSFGFNSEHCFHTTVDFTGTEKIDGESVLCGFSPRNIVRTRSTM